MFVENQKKLRYKLQDFYRNMAEGKIKLESVEPEENAEFESPERIDKE